jgi:hypothetical protein
MFSRWLPGPRQRVGEQDDLIDLCLPICRPAQMAAFSATGCPHNAAFCWYVVPRTTYQQKKNDSKTHYSR